MRLLHVTMIAVILLGCAGARADEPYDTCTNTASAATFDLAEEVIRGARIDPTPTGRLQMWHTGVYRFTNDAGRDDCGFYDYQSGLFYFFTGPLSAWGTGRPGEQRRSIWFTFKDTRNRSVEIVFQESLGCSPWPDCR